MYFVNDIKLGLPHRRRVLRPLYHFADIVNARVGRCVYLNQVRGYLTTPSQTVSALIARFIASRGEAVCGSRKESRSACLSHSARAGEKICVADTPRGNGVFQRLDHRLLA